jgi:hypothetical protein
LFDVMTAAGQTLGIGGKLPAVQKSIQSFLQATLPRQRDARLEAAGRELAARTFRQVASALEVVR